MNGIIKATKNYVKNINYILFNSALFLAFDWGFGIHTKRKYDTKYFSDQSESLPTNHEVPGSIPRSTVGIFPEGEDSHGDHGLGRLVEFRFKGPPDTTSSYITTHIIGTT